MARIARSPGPGLRADSRGVVYVEFLIAFVPLFVMFLGTCQMALLTTARIVVRHAAFSAVRSAVVVLEEPPSDYDDAPRGSLTAGSGSTAERMHALLAGLAATAGGFAAPSLWGPGGSSHAGQHGARMVPIRTAAYAPLLALAPREEELTVPLTGSLGRSLPVGLESRFAFALGYTQAAAVVTVHSAKGEDALPTEPIGSKAEVTVRVTYLYPCGVPFVRTLMCRTLDSLLGSEQHFSFLTFGGTPLRSRVDFAEAPGVLEHIAAKEARFVAINVEASLPNQGAAYYRPEGG